MKTSEVQDLHQTFVKAREEAETRLAPLIKTWCDLQVSLGRLTTQEAGQTYYPEEGSKPDHLTFRCEEWDEYWAYGGHEHHWAKTIDIPVSFFEDQDSYEEKVKAQQVENERLRKINAKREAEAEVRSLEHQLENAKKKAESL